MSDAPTPSPIHPHPIRERLLDAAEHEFARHGFQGASLRRLTAKAGVSLGNVRHLFGSKQGLFEAVHRRIFDPVVKQRLDGFDALMERQPNPTIIELFDTYSEAIVRLVLGKNGNQRGIFSMHGVIEHEVYWPLLEPILKQIGKRFTNACARALPELSEEEVECRWEVANRHFFTCLCPVFRNIENPPALTRADILTARRQALAILTLPSAHGFEEEYPYNVDPEGCK